MCVDRHVLIVTGRVAVCQTRVGRGRIEDRDAHVGLIGLGSAPRPDLGQAVTVRLWSLHPRWLDRQGLTACWREGLLAQAVLLGRTRGYTAHPQLERFRAATDPVASVGCYLDGVRDEAVERGYRFDAARIVSPPVAGEPVERIAVTSGQLELEWRHLLAKLAMRAPAVHASVLREAPTPHPLFFVIPGAVASWERAV